MRSDKKEGSGTEIKAAIDAGDINEAELLLNSKVSMSSLYRIYRDDPTVTPKLRKKVVGAFTILRGRTKASA